LQAEANTSTATTARHDILKELRCILSTRIRTNNQTSMQSLG
jgi:hypothetical protein